MTTNERFVKALNALRDIESACNKLFVVSLHQLVEHHEELSKIAVQLQRIQEQAK